MLRHIHARVIILDDKKCGNSKNAIDHIIKQLHICYGVNYPEKRGQVRHTDSQQKHTADDPMMSDDCSWGDRHEIEIQQNRDSDQDSQLSEVDEDEEIKNSE